MQLPYVYENVLKLGVKFTPNSFIREVRKDRVLLYNIYTGEETLREPIDTVVLETGRIPEDKLWHTLSRKVNESYIVGECSIAGRQMGDVISEAFDVAVKI